MASQGVELGQAPPNDAKRDAVHVAIVPATYACEEGFSSWAVRQDLARAVSGVPDLDPFHRDDLIPNCLAWLKENW